MNSSNPLYTLLDSGHGRKLERVGGILIDRPEPQALWAPALPVAEWDKAQATFAPKLNDEENEGGNWQINANLPERWPVSWLFAGNSLGGGDFCDLSSASTASIQGGMCGAEHKQSAKSAPPSRIQFHARLTPFRHLGFFAEQTPQWEWLSQTVKPGMKVLNLFGYTGVASLVAAKAGAQVTHLDASKKALGYGRENAELAGLAQAPIKWIPDDAVAFCQREVRRGNRYDVVLLDPPKFGRGPDGEVWEFMRDMPTLLQALSQLVNPGGHVWLTAYTLRLSGVALASMLQATLGQGTSASGEFTVTDAAGRSFGVSMWGRWSGLQKS